MSGKEKLIEYAKSIYGGIIDELNWVADLGDGVFGSVNTIISDASGSSVFDEMRTIGYSILICIFLIHLGESALKDKNDPDGLIKDIALLGLYGMIIVEMDSIIGALTTIVSRIGQTALGGIMGTGTEKLDAGLVENLVDNVVDGNILLLLVDAVFIAIFMNIAVMIVKAIAYIAIYTVKIELFIRTVFFPLAVGFIAEDGCLPDSSYKTVRLFSYPERKR